MEGFAFGIAVASFVAMMIMAGRNSPQAPLQPVIYASAEPQRSDSHLSWLIVVFLIVVILIGVYGLR